VILVLVVVLAVASCSCVADVAIHIDRLQQMVRTTQCQDGAPARVLVDPHCVDGICGITCAPDRWHPEERKEP
jgi:hypothetical protein